MDGIRFFSSSLAPAELKQLLDEGAYIALFDVRDPVEVERSHIFGMTNLPRGRLESRVRDLVPDSETAIVLCCDGSSGRAELAAATLKGLGYGNVACLQGGMQAWEQQGGQMVSGSNVPSKRYGEAVLHQFNVPMISAAALKAASATGTKIVICDIRTPEEHATQCIPGAIGVPGFDMAAHARDLSDRYELVVVHCAGRTRSIIAARTLQELGIENAVALENGTMGWLLSGLDLEQGSQAQIGQPADGSVAYAELHARQLADAEGIKQIDGDQLERLLRRRGENHYVFDVRRVDDYRKGHISGSIALPGGQAVQRTDDFIALKQAPIVLIGERDAQSCLAGIWLRRMGCTDVSILQGGITAWTAQGRALVQGGRKATPAGYHEACSQVQFVSANELKQRLDAKAVHLFDVDHSVHFRKCHVPGAQWMARSLLEAEMSACLPDRTAPVALCSKDGVQSALAGAILVAMGYTGVLCLQGGTQAWDAAGYPVERGGLAPQDDELLPPYQRGRQAMQDYIAWEKLLVGLPPAGSSS